jgi:hypothetical protein
VSTVAVHTAQTSDARIEAGEGTRAAAPVPSPALTSPRRFGAQKGIVNVDPAFFDPLPPDEPDLWYR